MHAASTETGERVALGRYAHRRSKQTQFPSGGTLLSQPTAGGEAAAATQRLGRHGSSQAQSLSFAHDAAARASAPDGVGGVAPGPGAGLTAAPPGVAVPSVGAASSVLVAGADGAGGGVGLPQATIVRVAAIVRLAKSAVRFTAVDDAMLARRAND